MWSLWISSAQYWLARQVIVIVDDSGFCWCCVFCYTCDINRAILLHLVCWCPTTRHNTAQHTTAMDLNCSCSSFIIRPKHSTCVDCICPTVSYAVINGVAHLPNCPEGWRVTCPRWSCANGAGHWSDQPVPRMSLQMGQDTGTDSLYPEWSLAKCGCSPTEFGSPRKETGSRFWLFWFFLASMVRPLFEG